METAMLYIKSFFQVWNDEEKENLAAVMILGERKSRNDKHIRDNLDKKGEDR